MTHYLTTQDDRDHAAARADRATAEARARNDATARTPRLCAMERIADLAAIIDGIDQSLASPWMTNEREAAYQRRRRAVLIEALESETRMLRGLTVVAVTEKREAA